MDSTLKLNFIICQPTYVSYSVFDYIIGEDEKTRLGTRRELEGTSRV